MAWVDTKEISTLPGDLSIFASCSCSAGLYEEAKPVLQSCSRHSYLMLKELASCAMQRFSFHYFVESSLQEEILSVCLWVCGSVDLSVITFSFFKYSMIWWFRPCRPYIFWKLIMLATSTALFWPSNTEYQPAPPSSDQVINDLMV